MGLSTIEREAGAFMTLKEAIIKAVTERNSFIAGQIADKLRFKYKLNYADSFEVIRGITPKLSLAEWDSLLNESDS